MWRILQQENADDFVFATGETHSVREFVEESCRHIGIEIGWTGTRGEEKGVIRKIDLSVLEERLGLAEAPIRVNDVVVELDPSYLRPTEVDLLIGDASKAEKILGWKAETRFNELAKIMIDDDLAAYQQSPKRFLTVE